MQHKEIYIIGFGAIGKALAAFLTAQGRRVRVIRGSVNDGSRAQEDIVIDLADGATLRQSTEVVTLKSVGKTDGPVILATKSYGNKELALALKSKSENSPIVLLQNGLNIEKPFLDNGFSQIYRCVLFATGLALDNGLVRFRSVANSPAGLIKGDIATLNEVVEQINTPYFRFETQKDIQTVIWKKAIMNVVFNSVCPLLETDNGIFNRDASALRLAGQIIKSCTAIAGKAGIRLNPQEIETGLLHISKASDGQLISTLQDINNGRRTEIDTLNFQIAEIAEKNKMTIEAQQILLLGELIKIKEKINLTI